MAEGTYDVFLCYNSRDKTAVERLARRLRDAFRVFYDDWELIAGRPVQEQLEAGLEKSRTYAVFLGAEGFGRWQNEEMRVAVEARVLDKPKQVIPVLLPDASEDDLPPFLRRLGYVDFRAGPDDSDAFHRLVSAVGGVAPGPGPAPGAAPAPPGDRRSNPFHASLAVRDGTRFVGRRTELRRLREHLAHGCVALLGEPKIGKSSLLLELKRSWEGDVIGPIDFYDVEDRDDFYATLAEELGLEASDWRGSVRPELRRRRVLLLLDELDAALPDKLVAEDLGRLRAVCQKNRHLKLVAVSRAPVKELFPDAGRGSPVYNFLAHFDLGPLEAEDVRRLLAPWGEAEPVFEERVVDEVVGLVDGHPAKAQLAAWTVLLLLAYALMHRIRLPGVDPAVSTDLPYFDLGRAGILALGIRPFFFGFLVVELYSLLAPKGRQVRSDATAGRRRLNGWAIRASITLALLQAASVIAGLEGVELVPSHSAWSSSTTSTWRSTSSPCSVSAVFPAGSRRSASGACSSSSARSTRWQSWYRTTGSRRPARTGRRSRLASFEWKPPRIAP